MHRTRTETKPDPMVVDRHARTLVANALLGFMQGRIYRCAFEMAFDSGYKFSHDRSAMVLSMDLASWFCDFDWDEPIRVNEEGREVLCRAWVFLQTDLHYSRKFRWKHVKEYWPFASLAEWRAHEHLLPTMLPEYDPALAPPPPPPPPSELRVWAPIILTLGIFLAIVAGLFLWGFSSCSR